MLFRLIIAIMLAAFAVPGVAAPACHDAPMTRGHAMPMDKHHDAVPAHSCIGCIPLADWTAARVLAPMLAVQPISAPIVARLDLGRGWPPALPPPRIG